MSKKLTISSWNVNGIRACMKKGFLDWFNAQDHQIVCLQEVRAPRSKIPVELVDGTNKWHISWVEAQKAGYSGVAVLSQEKPLQVIDGIGVQKFDLEGRVVTVVFSDIVVVNAYFPNSQDGGKRLEFKQQFCASLQKYMTKLEQNYPVVVLCGDYNIAHNAIDLARPKENEFSPGFFAQERRWMDEFLSVGWVDVFRWLYPTKKDAYTWWSMRTMARERNVGWRIDYHCINQAAQIKVVDCQIQGKTLGSDHCPVVLDLSI